MTNANACLHNLSSSMVSQPYSGEQTLAVRRPPSVSSRSTTARRHRGNRSHHGGSSYTPQNEFPNFAHTGDVEILISHDGQEKRYMLHRLILSQCSGFFEASTSEEWSRAQAQPHNDVQDSERLLSRIGEEGESSSQVGTSVVPTAHQGHRPRWRYELDPSNQQDEVPMLIQKPLPSTLFGGDRPPVPPPTRNKPPAPSNGFFRSISAMQSAIHIPQLSPQNNSDNDVIRDYDNLFRIFYNYPPALDSVNITEAYIQCKTLLALADVYDALDVVGPRIDHHLLQFQSRLWKQIAKYPPSYLKLGYLARSKVIFAESLVHVVGQWPSGSAQLQNIPESVLELIEDKVDDLQDLKAKVEGRLFRLSLTTSRGDRATPYNAYLDWQATSLFREWLVDNTMPKPPLCTTYTSSNPSRQSARPPFNPDKIYPLLGRGGSSYLGHEELKRFQKLRPDDYSRENLKKFERRMDEIKALAKEMVKPLMRSFLELDLGRDGGTLGYLTCTKVAEADFPWN